MGRMLHSRSLRTCVGAAAMFAVACSSTSLDQSAPPSECPASPALSGGTQHCSSAAQGYLSGGFQWSVWSSGSGGCITTYNTGCAFKATWNNSGDFLARAGYQWSSTQTYDQLGTISADYAFTKSGTGGDYSYIGIYGWSKNPLVEFYIVEDWFSKPNPGTKVDTITVDGDTYVVYKNHRDNAASIEGTSSSFDQFFSVRQSPRQCGHIAISTHFAEWANLGLQLGKMYEAKILAEAGGGSGTVDFTSATMSITK
jgi:endo-1,4-beta-xylanase